MSQKINLYIECDLAVPKNINDNETNQITEIENKRDISQHTSQKRKNIQINEKKSFSSRIGPEISMIYIAYNIV